MSSYRFFQVHPASRPSLTLQTGGYNRSWSQGRQCRELGCVSVDVRMSPLFGSTASRTFDSSQRYTYACTENRFRGLSKWFSLTVMQFTSTLTRLWYKSRPPTHPVRTSTNLSQGTHTRCHTNVVDTVCNFSAMKVAGIQTCHMAVDGTLPFEFGVRSRPIRPTQGRRVFRSPSVPLFIYVMVPLRHVRCTTY